MGAPARFPIFVSGVDENETFGLDYDVYDCPICYDPATRTKFWGECWVLCWDSTVLVRCWSSSSKEQNGFHGIENGC